MGHLKSFLELGEGILMAKNRKDKMPRGLPLGRGWGGGVGGGGGGGGGGVRLKLKMNNE